MSVYEYIAFAVFVALLGFFLYLNKKKVILQKIFFPLIYIVMFKSQAGLKLMDSIASKFKKPLDFFSYFVIAVGFIGMGLMCFLLIKNVYDLFFVPNTISTVMPVLPIKAKGVFYIPIFYWLPAIFILAVVHEFAHGIFARLYNLKVKSSGFAFISLLIPIIPLAFVEPDEKQLVKRPAKQQMALFAAGAFANVLLAFVVLGVLLAVAGPVSNVFESKGVIVTDVLTGYPAEQAGLTAGQLITSVDSQQITTTEDFTYKLSAKKPGEKITLGTNVSSYEITLVENPEKKGAVYMGINVAQNTVVKESFNPKWIVPAISYLVGFLYILFVLNIGVGLFNLVPMGPIDGGRMLQVALSKIFKPQLGNQIWKFIGIGFLVLIFISLAFSFIK